MRELTKNEIEYKNFINEVSKYCEYIQFSFDFDFGNGLSNQVTSSVIDKILQSNSEKHMINLELFSLLYLDYIDLYMTPMGDEDEYNYPVKKITITSYLNQKIIDLLKTFGSLYRLTTINPPQEEVNLILDAIGVDISSQERTVVEYTSFGMGSLSFLDEHQRSIISISSTEGNFHTEMKFSTIDK